MLKELCPRLKPGARIASMGYPDMIAPPPAIEKMLGAQYFDLQYRGDSDAICGRHAIDPPRKIPDAMSFFGLLGAELDVFDIVQERGDEIICDLNYPIDNFNAQREYLEEYDFVLDVGTLEHCFNISQAAFNMVNLLKKGGIIFHENPFNWGNHGFYGLNPTWYADFYGQAGLRLITCIIRTKEGRLVSVSPTERYSFLGEEANLFAIAERTEILPLTFPMQTKYRKMTAAGDNRANATPATGAKGD